MINFSNVSKVDWWFVISHKLVSGQLSSISRDNFRITVWCYQYRMHWLKLSCCHLEVSCTRKECKSMSRVSDRTLNTPWLRQEWSSISIDSRVHSQVVAWKRLTLKNVLACSTQLSQKSQGTLFATSSDINTLFNAWVAGNWPAVIGHKSKSWWFIFLQNTFVGRTHWLVACYRRICCLICLSPYLLSLLLTDRLWLFEER